MTPHKGDGINTWLEEQPPPKQLTNKTRAASQNNSIYKIKVDTNRRMEDIDFVSHKKEPS